MKRLYLRPLVAFCAIVTALVFVVAEADARASRGGSRGTQTFSPAPRTNTAPNAAKPLERTMTQPSQPSAAARPAAPAPSTGLFGRTGFMGGLFAGFLGAGLLGLLFGHGLTGGLGGLASMLGLILQIGIVALIAYLVWTWWQRRSQPATASGPSLRDMPPQDTRPAMAFGSLGGLGGHQQQPVARAAGTDEVGLTPDDFNSFEKLLGDVQTAYGKEDLHALRSLASPEMVSYFSEDLSENASRGVVNKLSGVNLLQGDLAEAWREGATDYATVAMRYAIDDQMVERASGRVVEGGPQEATELWTFMRSRGGNWILSAIQQA